MAPHAPTADMSSTHPAVDRERPSPQHATPPSVGAARGHAGASNASTGGRLGYLLSQFPSANHTYLLREVEALRAAGVPVIVVAVDGDTRPIAALTPEEVAARRETAVVKRAGGRAVVVAHAATALSRPAGYAAGLAAAVRLAGWDLRRVLYHLFYFGEAVVAGRLLRRAGCTHVHTHYATNVAVLAARVFAFELSATIHGSAEFIDPRAYRLREKIAACEFVRAISLFGRSQLMLASAPEEWGKLEVVRLGVDPDLFQPGREPSGPGPFRLLSVGQLQPAKGFHLLIDAVAALAREGRDLSLTIVGDGAQRASLEARARQLGIHAHVTFTGALNQVEVRRLMRESDAFALASFAEGIPVVLMEAMATSLPCVATRITGIPELIEDGVSGLLVTPSDEGALIAALARLADDPDLRRRLGREALAQVRRLYDLGTNTSRLVDLFRRRLGAARSAAGDER